MHLRHTIKIASLLLAIPIGCWSSLATPAEARETATDSFQIAIPKLGDALALPANLSDPLWQKAAHVSLTYNLRNRTDAGGDRTDVYIFAGDANLYVAFNAVQRSTPVQATTRTNDANQSVDDQVVAYFWPQGVQGFAYRFAANPIGARNQSSSENTSYSPHWESIGSVRENGYTVVMKIPLKSMRGNVGTPWRVQFERTIASTLDDFEWAHAEAQTYGNAGNVLFSGTASGVPYTTVKRPASRFTAYGLEAIAASRVGGNTSRAGLDLAVPVSASASFIATFHPDYSNVEVDQQTIAPTAFSNHIAEIRPFFTQGMNFYNNFNGIGTLNNQELYTPYIPTPKYGYAIEGKQGEFNFAAFDAVGSDRVDTAQTLGWQTPNRTFSVQMQRVSSDAAAVHDVNVLYGFGHDSQRGFGQYLNLGHEYGSLVKDASGAERLEAGAFAYGANSFVGFSLHKIGKYYLPNDGYIDLTDAAGYSVTGNKTWYNRKTAIIPRVIVAFNMDATHNSAGVLNFSSRSLAVGFDLQHRVHVRAQTGSLYLQVANGVVMPASTGNGLQLDFHYRTDTQTTFSYNTGRFGTGRLASWRRLTGFRVLRKALFALEADDNMQSLDSGIVNHQWLERGSIAFEISPDSSLALGVRRTIGSPVTFGMGATPSVNRWNVSGAYHKRFGSYELYLVYGDASAQYTAPQFIIKLVRYVGAEKGT